MVHEIDVKKNTGSPDLITWSNSGPGKIFWRRKFSSVVLCLLCFFRSV